MAAPGSLNISDRFVRRTDELLKFVSKVEDASESQFLVREVKIAYEGAFLSLMTHVERSVELVFFGRAVGASADRRPLNPAFRGVSNARLLQETLVGDNRKFVDWLPLHITEKRTKRVFSENPFASITSDQKLDLDAMHSIRNAIAHRSEYALSKFKEKLVEDRFLPPQEHSPAGYLRGVQSRRSQGNLNRFEFYVARTRQVVGQICS